MCLEIQAALDWGNPLIPLLVGGANMPAEAALPPSLTALARRQVVVLSDSNWRGDVERLLESLLSALPTIPKKPRAKRWLLAMAVVATLIGTYAIYRFALDGPRPAPTVLVSPPADITRRWTAQVKYDWGDRHDEVFEFKIMGGTLRGTASYLNGRLTIEPASLEGERLRITTRSQEMLGDIPWKEVSHLYIGKVARERIEFTLETSGGYSIHPSVEFVARLVGK